MHIKVIDLKTASEVESERIGLLDIQDFENHGRKMITVAYTNGRGETDHHNVGILNPNGSVVKQPGYEIIVSAAE